MIFDDLQTAYSDIVAYCKLPPRPPYGRYTRFLEKGGHEDGRKFWLSHQKPFGSLNYEFPVLEPGSTVSPSTMRIKRLLHLPIIKNTEFGLPTMGRTYLPRRRLPILFRLRSNDLFEE